MARTANAKRRKKFRFFYQKSKNTHVAYIIFECTEGDFNGGDVLQDAGGGNYVWRIYKSGPVTINNWRPIS